MLFKLIYCYFYVLACYRFKTSFLRQIQLNHMSITANSVLESRDTAATIQRAWHQLQRTFKTTPLFYHFSPAFISADIVYQCKYTCSRHNSEVYIYIYLQFTSTRDSIFTDLVSLSFFLDSLAKISFY